MPDQDIEDSSMATRTSSQYHKDSPADILPCLHSLGKLNSSKHSLGRKVTELLESLVYMHGVSVGCALQRDKELFSWMGGVLFGAMRMQSDLLQDYFVFHVSSTFAWS